jgi:hypothetical protein
MDSNCKSVHARAYTVTRSVEKPLQHSKETARFVKIGILKEDFSSEWAFLYPRFSIPKKR